jgi:hypothetical protein
MVPASRTSSSPSVSARRQNGNAVMDVTAVARVALLAAVATVAQPVPANLSALLAKARLDGGVAAWCGGHFHRRSANAFAVALTSPSGGGRYGVIQADGAFTELARFSGGADLSCYTRADAERLDRSIRQSETIHGRIAPRWDTTIACGFIEDTIAVCWQFDPASRAFVRIGGWTT